MKSPFLIGPLYQPTVLLNTMATAALVAKCAVLGEKTDHTSMLGQMLYDEQTDQFVMVIEACLALYYQIRNAQTSASLSVAICSFYHAIAGRSVTGSTLRLFDTLVAEIKDYLPFFQSGFGWVDVLDGLYTNTKRVVKSALGDKIAKVFNHVVAHALYAKMGIDFDTGLFEKLEKKVIRPTVWSVVSFLDAVTGLVLFLCKAGRQALMSGNIDCFFVDDMVLTDWLDEASRLRKNSEFMNTPQVTGIALPEYISDLNTCIERGRKILPYFKKGREHSILYNAVLELESILKRHQCAMLSASFRRAPICVFLYGTAGVAKSFIAAGLFNHYCAVRGIDSEKAKMWTRTEGEEYYSGYKSHFAGVMYDDAAKYRTSKIQGIDPSIGDIITAVNNIPFVTPQADLPDKGKIPFLSEFVAVTSNVGDLAADQYFNSSAAFLRRFAVRIVPIVKDQFRVKGEDRIDAKFLPEGVQYPELWDFEVYHSVVNGMKGEFVLHKIYGTYAELLHYMTGVYEKHIAQQDRLMKTVGMIGPEKLCVCRLPVSICQCDSDSEKEILNDNVDAIIQNDVQTSYPNPGKHWQRVGILASFRYDVMRRYQDRTDQVYIRQLFAGEDVAKWFNPEYAESDEHDQIVGDKIESELENMISEFSQLEARDKLNYISDGKFNSLQSGELDSEFMDFRPRIGRPGFFLQTQVDWLKAEIKKYCIGINDKENALLDVYVMEHAPKFIADGWALGDVIKAGYQYITFYSEKLEDPELVEVREFLMDTRKPAWYERLGVSFAVAYFENRTFHNCVNYLASIPLVERVVAWCVCKATQSSPRVALSAAGKAHDARLGGRNKWVRIFVMVAGAAAGLALIYRFAKYMMPKSEEDKERERIRAEANKNIAVAQKVIRETQDRVEHFKSCDVCARDIVGGRITTEDMVTSSLALEGTARDQIDEQMDLLAVGKKPIPREAEKKNVWVTPERNITRLDVDVRRPHNEDQAYSALKHNCCFATVRGQFPHGPGTGRTRVLVVDSETLVINNHALPPNSTVTVWLGKYTESGVQPSFVFELDEQMVTRHPSRDLAIVKTWAMPHRFKDIRHLFGKPSYQSVGSSVYFLKEKDGELVRKETIGVHKRLLHGMDGATNVSCVAWASHPVEPTKQGDCGMPLIINSPLGSIIAGIHAGYHKETNTAWSVMLSVDDFDFSKKYPTVGVTTPSFPLAQVQVISLKPTDKLFTDYHETGHMMTHGQLQCFNARPKFTGTHTPHASYVFSRGDEFSPPIEDNMAAPRNLGWQQPQSVLVNYLHPTHSMREIVMRACTKQYIQHIVLNLNDEDWEDIHPVPLSVAVNGFPGVPNVDAQKYTTSAGHGKRGPKLQFLTEPEKFEEWDAYRAYAGEVHEEIDTMRENAYKGIRPHAVYDAVMKDELLSKAKVEAGRARSIYMCPVALLTNVRMSTLGICRVMIRRRDIFGVAIGLNTHSEEWDDIYRICEELPGDNWIAGDFKNFESVLNLLISNCVSKVFVHMAQTSGNYNEEEIMALRVWLADISNATINFFGELITLLGGEASGQQMTTPFNCVANNLLHMYAYVEIYAKPGDGEEEFRRLARDFFKYVRRNTLGDDVYLKVSPEKPEYNHTSIQKVFENIGITYTMADKGAESRPYIPHQEVTFLKRSFADHSAFPGMKVATLDRKSIYKMLCYTVPSGSVSPEEQFAAAMASAQAEAFFHDREFFDQIKNLIDDLPKSPELIARMKEMPRPTWNQMCHRFVNASPKLKARQLVPVELDSETTDPKDSYCHASDLELQMEWSVDPWGSTTMECSSEDRIYGRVGLSSKRAPKAKKCEVALVPDNNDFSKNHMKNNKNTPTPNDRDMAPLVVEKAINEMHQKQRRDKKRKRWLNLVFQADIEYDTLSMPSHAINGSGDVVQENTVFKNEPSGVAIAFGENRDELVDCMKLPQDLASYLSRPRLLYTYTWAENGANGLKATINPWSLFFGNVNMANKLAGYGLLRSKLVIKVLINGSPFYYGSMMASYTPLSGYRSDTVGTNVNTMLVANSQKPHIWLENQNCSTAQMELPFLFPYPYIDITQLSNLTSMGKIDLYQYAPLLSANGTGSSNVDIQVYGWAVDTVLSGPTNLPVLQSEFIPDQQISKTASTVQAAAGALSKIPVVGAYAKATEMAAGAMAGAASYFGFTNVPNISDVQPYKPTPFQLASTEISEPVSKLSLQPKQETTIGASQHGGTTRDELVVKDMATRSSFLVGTQWDTTNTPGTILFTSAVSPQMFQNFVSDVAHTPMSWVANHFQWWRGSIKFTFKVIRSPYHRGRVQVSWDSMTSDLSQGPALGNPNTLTTIMDLDEDSECSFTVPYLRPELFQQCYNINTIGTTLWSTTTSPTGSFPGTNGVLSVRVLNRLTAPEASSSATILVMVSAGEDIEFAGPREFDVWNGNSQLGLRSTTVGVTQADIDYDDSDVSHELTPSGQNLEIYKQVFGERVTSLREVLHRSSISFMWEPIGYNSNTAAGNYNFRLPIKRFPRPHGVFNNGWNIGTTVSGANQRINYTKFHPIVSIGSCFIGYKGSVNVTVNVDQPRGGNVVDTLSICRTPFGDTLSSANRLPNLAVYAEQGFTIDSNARDDIQFARSGQTGQALTNTKTNTGMSAQLPYYSNAGFSLMDPSTEYNNQDPLTDRNNDWWEIEWRYNKDSTTNYLTGAVTNCFYSTGPDFDLIFFINVPVLTAISITTL